MYVQRSSDINEDGNAPNESTSATNNTDDQESTSFNMSDWLVVVSNVDSLDEVKEEADDGSSIVVLHTFSD